MTKVEIRIYSDRTGAGLSDEYISRWVSQLRMGFEVYGKFEEKDVSVLNLPRFMVYFNASLDP